MALTIVNLLIPDFLWRDKSNIRIESLNLCHNPSWLKYHSNFESCRKSLRFTTQVSWWRNGLFFKEKHRDSSKDSIEIFFTSNLAEKSLYDKTEQKVAVRAYPATAVKPTTPHHFAPVCQVGWIRQKEEFQMKRLEVNCISPNVMWTMLRLLFYFLL